MNEDPGTRTQIVEAARHLFARHGFQGASIRAITGRAGANLGAVTYHFGSKQALYEAVIESLVVPLAGRLRATAAGSEPPLERVVGAVRTLLEAVGERPEMAAIILHELSLDRPLPEPARRWISTLYGTLIGLVEEGQRDGSILPGDPRLLAASVLAQPFYLVMARRPLAEVAGIRLDDRVRDHLAAVARRILEMPARAA
jgi:AcrR family transcriptional regulator